MNGKERGFLLLTSTMGDPERKPLTVSQFRTLARRVSQMEKPARLRELEESDLTALGYGRPAAAHIVQLLSQEERLQRYVKAGEKQLCTPITRVSAPYPGAVRQRLGLDAPGCLWAKGNLALLDTPTVALVGSRELKAQNRVFAETVGVQAAQQGITLVSGNARGADRAAQDACLANGGSVICVVADELWKYSGAENVLYLSEDCFDAPFSAVRALSRNRVIHSLGYITFVAQCNTGIGGTWDGTVRNLRNGWSPVFCFDDGSPTSSELAQLGATQIQLHQLSDFSALQGEPRLRI